MAQLQRADILKLAHLSSLRLSDTEADALLSDLQNIISYVDQLNSVTLEQESSARKNHNVFREDVAQSTDSTPLIAQAPDRDGNYFVVPQVIDSSKDAQ